MNAAKDASGSGVTERVCILGAGNIGGALATGLVASGSWTPDQITLTRRNPELLAPFAERGFRVTSDNAAAVGDADLIVVAVQPGQLVALLEEIKFALDPERQVLISLVSGVGIEEIELHLYSEAPVVRAMPNTAIAIGESMTCLAGRSSAGGASDFGVTALARASALFEDVGRTLVIGEELMVSATALCACGVAFFLRSVRAASQGGIEIGFHPEEALLLASQTARGAASILLASDSGSVGSEAGARLTSHPEAEIDRVTTPRGCTIAGLNEMEHQGFSSAMIKGILLSAKKAGGLFEEG